VNRAATDWAKPTAKATAKPTAKATAMTMAKARDWALAARRGLEEDDVCAGAINRDNRSRNRLCGHVRVASPKSDQDKAFTGGPRPRRSTWSKETSLNSRELSALSR
jgi:hypothetical protein